MKIFKNWFSKQDKTEYQDDIGDSNAIIILGVDKNGDNFLRLDFEPGYEDKIAELIFLFNSASLLSDCIDILRDACNDDEVVIDIMHKVNHIAESMNNQQEEPVVDPCHVFRKGDDEFKG